MLKLSVAMLAILLTKFTMLAAQPLGLPPLPVPDDNSQTPEKVALGQRLFNDARFSSTGKISCATCHAPDKAFTDNLRVSKGINDLQGTRNAPTVINAAYNKTQFWDGREPSLEAQSKQPFLNPVEMALPNHEAILKIIRDDEAYTTDFKKVFSVTPNNITMDLVAKAIGSFERTIISGNSRFDRFYFSGENSALTKSEQRGFQVFLNEGRCVSCHVIEQTQALFTDHKFHNIGIGFKRVQGKLNTIADTFIQSKRQGANVDVAVLTSDNVSQLGRFAVNEDLTDMGAFKTSTLRNIDKTAPYMHDGSLETLEDVVTFYNNGGRLKESDPLDDFLSGGIRPLNLTEQQQKDLVAFMRTLTSPEHE